MKVILVNERLGHTRTYVIKGWLKGVLSLCLLGAPVALGYLGYHLSLQAGSGETVPYDAAVQHVLRGAPKPAEVQLPEREAASQITAVTWSTASRQPATTDSGAMLPVDRQQAVVVSPRYGVQPSRHQFRHGRSVDPASYQRRVYS
jgi:hypothetical protein